MNCVMCCKKIELSELLKCVGCKSGHHYRCAGVTAASFKEEQVQLKRTFKCDACLNVTQRVRVTDDTPVRSTAASTMINQPSLRSCDSNTSLLSPGDPEFMARIMEKVNSTIEEKLNILQTNFVEEIRAAVTVLAMENSQLRQELQAANKKCTSYEHEIMTLKSERQQFNKQMRSDSSDYQSQICGSVLTPNNMMPSTSTLSAVSSDRNNRKSSAQVSGIPSAGVTYAAVAMKTSHAQPTTEISDNSNPWTEVRYKKNPKIVGGNTSLVSLKAVERKKYLHVWRLDKSTTEEDLKKHVKEILDTESEIIIEKLKPKTERNYASFKIGVAECNFEKRIK